MGSISPRARLQEVESLFQNQVVPAFSRHKGFLGYTAYVDRDRGRFVGISLWETRQDLEASAGTALEARNAAADLGAETIGEPQILEMAFDARPPVSLPATHASTNTLLPQR